MINKVNQNMSVQVPNITKQSDEKLHSEKLHNEKNPTAKVPETQRFMEVFTVNFWSRNFVEAKEATNTIDITVNGEILHNSIV